MNYESQDFIIADEKNDLFSLAVNPVEENNYLVIYKAMNEIYPLSCSLLKNIYENKSLSEWIDNIDKNTIDLYADDGHETSKSAFEDFLLTAMYFNLKSSNNWNEKIPLKAVYIMQECLNVLIAGLKNKYQINSWMEKKAIDVITDDPYLYDPNNIFVVSYMHPTGKKGSKTSFEITDKPFRKDSLFQLCAQLKRKNNNPRGNYE